MKTSTNIVASLAFLFVSAIGTACSSSSTEKEAASEVVTKPAGQTSAKIVQLNAPDFAEKVKEAEVQLVDVRTAGEVATGKIPNAINIDYNTVNFEEMAAKLDPNKPVAVYCKVGGRSARAAKVFQELGFKQIFELEGGIISWNASGLATEKQ
ncbi:rhodanese-like domain-containing protein [Imperialibacter roseus]|uniref:Rhodanese-like domain-containing protein n=1 Tax=Imperialibacter roseus TaxID=1324217 RepID=A0ABZ0INF2_9BACT|nr:rhodanese-like domain-containing protein [Imperialibacter roseus]WOK05994.1 rhodanese-like domain-containing protein [Imperialibacter roseus]